MKNMIRMILVLALLAGVSVAQTAMTSTTLSAAVTATQTNFSVASATGFTASSGSATYVAYVDKEAMKVVGVSGTSITVSRGFGGTAAVGHTSGATIYVGTADRYINFDRIGTCSAAAEYPNYTPQINIKSGKRFSCRNSEWAEEYFVNKLTASYADNLDIQTQADGKPVRINSRNYTQTSGSAIGFQVKPAQTVNGESVIGGEISPRVNSGVTLSGSITGLHVDAYPKGTAAGTITGNVRGLEVELVTDDAGTRTISGYVTGMRIRTAFSATGITGTFSAIRIEANETQTNSQNYDAVFDLTSTVSGVWHNTDVDSGDTEAGYIKVMVNGTARYIVLYSDAPTL